MTRKPYCAPRVGHQVATRVLAPGCIGRSLRRSRLWVCAFAGIHFSWCPSRVRRLHAFRQEALDRPVLTNTSGGFGIFARWVSRSAMWMPLTPVWRIRSAHSAFVFGSGTLSLRSAATLSSACLAKNETMPGLAPQQETAVVERACAPSCGERRFAQRIVGARGRALRGVEVESEPRLVDVSM